jgi:aminopeptidase N
MVAKEETASSQIGHEALTEPPVTGQGLNCKRFHSDSQERARGIRNDRPIIPTFGVNASGSGDMYPKGGNMLHTIRTIIDDDSKWRGILRGLQQTFRHQAIAGQQVRDYISREAGIDLSKVFQQYLETARIPEFEYRVEGTTLSYRWTKVVPGFDMPLRVSIPGMGTPVLRPTEAWQTMALTTPRGAELVVDENYYVTSRNVGATAGTGGSR